MNDFKRYTNQLKIQTGAGENINPQVLDFVRKEIVELVVKSQSSDREDG